MKKALLVIGNPLKGDDAVALYLGKMVEEKLKEWKVFYGEDVPENQIYTIKKYTPDILIVADAIVGIKNSCEFLELNNSSEYIYTTHNIPVEILINLLKVYSKKVIFLGIGVSKENLKKINPHLSMNAINNVKKAFLKIKSLTAILNQ